MQPVYDRRGWEKHIEEGEIHGKRFLRFPKQLLAVGSPAVYIMTRDRLAHLSDPATTLPLQLCCFTVLNQAQRQIESNIDL